MIQGISNLLSDVIQYGKQRREAVELIKKLSDGDSVFIGGAAKVALKSGTYRVFEAARPHSGNYLEVSVDEDAVDIIADTALKLM